MLASQIIVKFLSKLLLTTKILSIFVVQFKNKFRYEARIDRTGVGTPRGD